MASSRVMPEAGTRTREASGTLALLSRIAAGSAALRMWRRFPETLLKAESGNSFLQLADGAGEILQHFLGVAEEHEGVIEAGCKTVVGKRAKQSGMFWTAQNILDIRCSVLSDTYDEYWEGRRRSEIELLQAAA